MPRNITKPIAKSIEGQAILSWYKSTQLFKDGLQSDDPEAACPVKIYRRTEEDFNRENDYEEFFMGKSFAGSNANSDGRRAELIFDGELAPTNSRKFTFIDKAASYRTTYSYFISMAGEQPVGPIPLRPADPLVYWSYERLLNELQNLVDSASNKNIAAQLNFPGRAGSGRGIPRLQIGSSGPRLVLVGLIHPGESGPELIIPALGNLLENEPQLFKQVQVTALPAVNVDGRQLQAQGTPWYIRKTLAGTDLNRNFPANWDQPALGYGLDSRDPVAATYRGPAPGSAPETQAVMAALKQTPPDVLISYHCLASLCSLPALYPVAAKDNKAFASRCEGLIEAFATGLFPDDEFDKTWARPGTSQGSLPAWVYQEFKAPAFDLEMGAVDKQEVDIARRDMTTPDLLKTYQQKHTQGLKALLKLLAKQTF